jgi:hypothetical protein
VEARASRAGRSFDVDSQTAQQALQQAQTLDPADPVKRWSTPSITPTQWLGLPAAIAAIVTFDSPVTKILFVVLVVAWWFADAIIRHSRAHIVVTQIGAGVSRAQSAFDRQIGQMNDAAGALRVQIHGLNTENARLRTALEDIAQVGQADAATVDWIKDRARAAVDPPGEGVTEEIRGPIH